MLPSREFLTLDRAAETPAPSTASTKLMGAHLRCQIHAASYPHLEMEIWECIC